VYRQHGLVVDGSGHIVQQQGQDDHTQSANHDILLHGELSRPPYKAETTFCDKNL
jgi:hypothetical protein